jgi:hypothetical protein
MNPVQLLRERLTNAKENQVLRRMESSGKSFSSEEFIWRTAKHRLVVCAQSHQTASDVHGRSNIRYWIRLSGYMHSLFVLPPSGGLGIFPPVLFHTDSGNSSILLFWEAFTTNTRRTASSLEVRPVPVFAAYIIQLAVVLNSA